MLGLNRDTVSVTVAPDQWIPTDGVYVIEEIDLFQTRVVNGVPAIVVDGSGNPVSETRREVVFSPIDLRCGTANPSCNPVTGQGSGGWIGVRPDDQLHLQFASPFTTRSSFVFVPRRAVGPDDVLSQERSIREQMEFIRVVPNPYLFFSQYEANPADRRLMFTNLPPTGQIRIYTVAGNFVQEIDWGPGDLVGNGDLFWNMQTREGNEVGAGLYLFVVTAQDPATGGEVKEMGKFVVIR